MGDVILKIIRKGSRNQGSFRFKCDKCNCQYEANQCEYSFVKYSSATLSWEETNELTEHIQSRCPNCNHIQQKSLYSKSDKLSLFRIFAPCAAILLQILSIIVLVMFAPVFAESNFLFFLTAQPLLVFVLCVFIFTLFDF